MRTTSQNLAFEESRETGADVAKTTGDWAGEGAVANWAEASRLATESLQLRQIKAWAADLSVSPRTVQRWASGELSIPRARVVDIIALTKGYFLHLGEIEAAIDRLILSTRFGTRK